MTRRCDSGGAPIFRTRPIGFSGKSEISSGDTAASTLRRPQTATTSRGSARVERPCSYDLSVRKDRLWPGASGTVFEEMRTVVLIPQYGTRPEPPGGDYQQPAPVMDIV